MKLLEPTQNLEKTEALRELFREQGYLYVKGFFDPQKINLLRTRAFEILESEGWGERKGSHIDPIGKVNRVKSQPFFSLMTALMREEQLHLFANDPTLKNLIGSLLGKEPFAHLRKMVRVSYPYQMNPDDHIPPHQDLLYVKGELDTLIAWIPLGNYPPSHGGLLVAHGSHKLGLVPGIEDPSSKFSGCDAANVESLGLDWRLGNYEVGDLLLMHTLTLHCAGKNESPHFRLSFDCRYSAIDGAISQFQLLPPYFPNIPSWESLSRDWVKKDLVSVPSSLNVESNDTPAEVAMNRPSLFVSLQSAHLQEK